MNRKPRTVSRRSLLGAFLALQGAVLAGAPVVDALLEASTPVTVTHFESEDAPPCPPAHDDLFCPLCQIVKLQALPGVSAPLPAAPGLGAPDDLRSPADSGFGPAPTSLHARAPPSV